MLRFIPPAVAGLLAAGLLLGVAPPAGAQSADEATAMAAFFSGTLEIDLPAADWSAKRYLSADHTYRETGSDGPVTGTWKVQDGKVCTSASVNLGFDRAQSYCNDYLGHKAGETWRDKDPITGNVVIFKLVAGRKNDR